MTQKIDWAVGIPFTAYSLRMPKGFHLWFSVSVHKSGRVTLRQSVGWMASFARVMAGDCEGLSVLDRANELVRMEVEA